MIYDFIRKARFHLKRHIFILNYEILRQDSNILKFLLIYLFLFAKIINESKIINVRRKLNDTRGAHFSADHFALS